MCRCQALSVKEFAHISQPVALSLITPPDFLRPGAGGGQEVGIFMSINEVVPLGCVNSKVSMSQSSYPFALISSSCDRVSCGNSVYLSA